MSHLSDLPVADRPRERLLTSGAETLTEPELLAVVLRTGTRERSALDLGQALIDEYGSLAALAAAPPADLATRAGLGPARIAALKAAFRLGHLASQAEGPR